MLFTPSPCHKLSHLLGPPPRPRAWRTLWTAPYRQTDRGLMFCIIIIATCLIRANNWVPGPESRPAVYWGSRGWFLTRRVPIIIAPSCLPLQRPALKPTTMSVGCYCASAVANRSSADCYTMRRFPLYRTFRKQSESAHGSDDDSKILR